MEDYYVYVYIDPRNFEEFYYGKGKDSRKNAHLEDQSDTQKSKRISAISAAGLAPIIRVIARGLSEHDAFLVEKTLLWKLGRQLTNVSSGHYAQNFRPHDTMHELLPGFDFQAAICYYNIGEGTHRNWDDFKTFGLISGGQGKRWRDAMLGFEPGDIIAAYLKGRGFVGIGRILDRAKPVRNVVIDGKPLLGANLHCQGMASNVDSDVNCEFVCRVEWLRAVERSEAKWSAKSNIYTTTHVRASLDGQPATIDFLNQQFDLVLRDLLPKR